MKITITDQLIRDIENSLISETDETGYTAFFIDKDYLKQKGYEIMEDFKPIKGYENKYSISLNGDILNIRKNKLLKLTQDSNGYLRVTLTKNKKSILFSHHRLVAENFIPNPKNKPCINHVDGNKTNNSIGNLEWVTYSENHKHAYANGLMNKKGQKHHFSKLTTNDVKHIRENKENKNAKELAEIYNVSVTTIYDVKNNKIYIEKHKSKLEIAREHYSKKYTYITNYADDNYHLDISDLHQLRCLYENAIEEIQGQNKIDDDLVNNIKTWMDVNTRASSWNLADISEAICYFKEIFKQLGIEDKL